MEKQKTILVAGGAGFIGSHLCRRLLGQGHKVVCIDNLITGSLRNIEDLRTNSNFVFTLRDIRDNVTVDDYVYDEIYNLACPASPPQYQVEPLLTTMTCVMGTYRLLELATQQNAKILIASTSEVYGDPDCSIQSESYRGNVNPIGIRSCYDEGKRCGETLCFDFNRQFNTRIKVIRIFNTYGERMDKNDGRVVSNFIVQALTNSDITIYGDGSQTRSFQYVSDLIDGMLMVMDTDDSFTGPVNLGNPEEYTIKQIADKVLEMTNSHSKIVYKALPQDDPSRRKPDISLAMSIGFNPCVKLGEGLQKTIDYFKQVVDNQEDT